MMRTARSVPDGISSTDLTEGIPRIVSPLGLTGMTWPPNPASRMFLKIWNPIFSGFAEAPMTARRSGLKSAWRESVISFLEGRFAAYRGIRGAPIQLSGRHVAAGGNQRKP